MSERRTREQKQRRQRAMARRTAVEREAIAAEQHEHAMGEAWMRFVRSRFPQAYPLPTLTELVYDYGAAKVIRSRWPHAVFTDATDIVHDSRFEVSIADCDEDEFYAVMLLEGWAECCLKFELRRRMPEHHADVHRYFDRARAMKDAGYSPGDAIREATS